MSFDELNALLATPRGGRWVKLRDAGDKIVGELLDVEMINRTDPSGEIVLGKKSGKPRRVARIRIQIDPESPDDDGVRIFDANESAQTALQECVRRDGALAAGGTIAIAVTESPKDSYSQATYAAKFKPGKASAKKTTVPVDVDELI